MPNLEKLFDKIDASEKDRFLWEILQNEEKIKKMFLDRFFQTWEEVNVNEPPKFDLQNLLSTIREESMQISAGLSQLDFEEIDWDAWDSPGYYVPDYEAAEMIAEEQIDEILEGFMDNLKEKIQYDDLTAIVVELSALVNGIRMAEINDPYDCFPDSPNEFMHGKLKYLLIGESDNLKSRKFLLSDIKNAWTLLLNYQEKEGCGNLLLPISADLLLSVIKTRENAQVVWQLAQDFKIDLKEFPDLLNHIVNLLDNKKLWVETMESIFLSHYQSSEDLMTYYYESNKELFNQKAPILFNAFKSQSYDFLLGKVKKGSTLHISVLKYAVLQKEKISAFEELKKYLSHNEILTLIESIEDFRFRIKLWNHEKMYDKIDVIISKEIQNGDAYDSVEFAQSIQYLFKPKPDAAIHLTKQKVNAIMKVQRNRDTYQYITKLLKQALNIPGKQEQVYAIAKDLYHHKPNLPALKDELRKAGLIKT